MGTSAQADRRSYQPLFAVQWFRLWLWVLLWAVLTSGVEPSQRAVGGTAPCVDLQQQQQQQRGGRESTIPPPPACSGTRLEGRDPPSANSDDDDDEDSFGLLKDRLEATIARYQLRQRADPSNTGQAGGSDHRGSVCPEIDDDLDSSADESCLTEDGTGASTEPPRYSRGAWVSKRGRGGGGGDGELRLEPPVLDFGESPVCIPTSAVVEVRNQRSRRGSNTRRRACGSGAQAQTDGPCFPNEDLANLPPDASTAPAAGLEGGEEEWVDVVAEEGSVGGFAAGAGEGEGEGWVQLLSVTSDNPQFHPASFQPHALPPEGGTSFQVVFLPGAVGAVDAVLTVATSAGDIRYKVQAQAVQNPHKVEPIVATRIPAGSTYTQPIIVYNPRDAPTLAITEIFTTEGFLHLAMPEQLMGSVSGFDPHSGVLEREESASRRGFHHHHHHHHHHRQYHRNEEDAERFPTAFRDPGQPAEGSRPKPPGLLVEGSTEYRSAWHIPPGAEMEVIRVSFAAEAPGEFKGYVHIRTDERIMVVPIEMHVSRGGVDPSPSEVDFGVLTSPLERRQASVSLFNGGARPILILGASVSNPDPRINVGFREGTVIAAGEGMDDAVRLVYSGGEPVLAGGERATDPTANVGGKVLIAVNHTTPELSLVEIDYRAHVLHGGVAYEWGQVSFQVDVGGGSTSRAPVSAAAAAAAAATAAAQAGQGAKADAAPSSGNDRDRKNNASSSQGGGPQQSWKSAPQDDASGERQGGNLEQDGGSGSGSGTGELILETRDVELKNHFPVAMQLMSLAMEDCQDILSVSGVDPASPASVALPQETWGGVHISFRRSAVAAAVAGGGGLGGGDDGGAWSPSSAPPALEPRLADEEEEPGSRGRPLLSGGGGATHAAAAGRREKDGGGGGSHYPSPEGDDGGEGLGRTIPSVSADQRTIAQRALDDLRASMIAAVAAKQRKLGSLPAEVDGEELEEEEAWRGNKKKRGGAGSSPSSASSAGRSLPFTCTLRAETNASTHHIPVFVFDGTLHFGFLGESGGGSWHGHDGRASAAAAGGPAGSKKGEGGGVFEGGGGGAVEVDSPWPLVSMASPTAVTGLPPDSRSASATSVSTSRQQQQQQQQQQANHDSGTPGEADSASSAPGAPRPLVVDLGILRAGATGRRRFNVTNLNPVEVNLTSAGGGGALPFASVRLVGVGPLERAPQVLSEIGKHIQARSLENAAATAATAAAAAIATARDSSTPSERKNAGTGAPPARLASAHPRPGAPGGAGGGFKRSSDRSPARGRDVALPPLELVRETLVDGVVSGRETFLQAGGPAMVTKGWVTRRAAAGGSGRGSADGGESHVCTLVPGATAMFEVAATAPEEVAEGPVKMEVSGLLLSTPVETVPLLVTYSAVSGGIFFHAPPLATPPASTSVSPPSREQHSDQPETATTTVASGGRALNHPSGEAEEERAVAVDEAAAAQLEEEGATAVAYLDNAFPGKLTVAPVSLRSTAAWEGRVEGMESSGPLVRATLTRTDVPGLAEIVERGAGSGEGSPFPGAEADLSGVVQVGQVEYDAAADCAGADAWTCLARTVEEASYHRKGPELRRARWDGGDGEDGSDGGLFEEDGEEEALELTLMRLVEVLHDERRVEHQKHTRTTALQGNPAYSSTIAGGGGPSDAVAVYRCGEGHVLMADPNNNNNAAADDDDDELKGCDRPRLVPEGGKGLAATTWGGGYAVAFGEGAASVSDTSTAAAKELWRIWPQVVASGMNRFQEEVAVETSLGPAATPLTVSVSVTVPRLVAGVARMSSVCPLSSKVVCPYSAEDGTDEVVTPTLLAAAAAKHKLRMANGGRDDPTGADRSSSGASGSSSSGGSGGGGGGPPVIRFPLTQVGEERDVYIEVRNPADLPVGVQLSAGQGESLVWTEAGRDGQAASTVVAVGIDVADLGKRVGAAGEAAGRAAGEAAGRAAGRAQSVQQLELVREGSFAAGALSAFHMRMGAFLPVILPPGGRAVIGPLRFTPEEAGVFSAHVFLRNNLTHLEPILLEGEAGAGVLSVRPWGDEARSGAGVVADSAAAAAPGSAAWKRKTAAAAAAAKKLLFGGEEEEAGRSSGGTSTSTSTTSTRGRGREGGAGEEEDGQQDPSLEVVRFPVDFRSWARSPPTTDPVVKRWVLSNEGTMPLVVHGVGIRKTAGGGWSWGWAWSRDRGSRAQEGREGGGAVGRWLRWVFFGSARREASSSSSLSRSRWGRWGAVTAAAATEAATSATADVASAARAASVLCADGGFRVVGEACRDEWQPRTLLPGQEMEVEVDYSAAHCYPVGRTLDFVSSAGTTSVQMVASALGGPSAISACRSARRAAAAASAGKGTAMGIGAAKGRGQSGRTGLDARWSRAWLLAKLALFAVAVYTGGRAFLGAGLEVPRLPRWALWLQARAVRCLGAVWRRYEGFAVSVEVRALAAVVLSSSSSSSSSSLSSEVSRSSFVSGDTKNKASRRISQEGDKDNTAFGKVPHSDSEADADADAKWEGAKDSRAEGLSPTSDKDTKPPPPPPHEEEADATKTATVASATGPKPGDAAPVPAATNGGGVATAGASPVKILTSPSTSTAVSQGRASRPGRQPHAAPSSGENFSVNGNGNLRKPQKGVQQQQQQPPVAAPAAPVKRDQGDDTRRWQNHPSAMNGHRHHQQQQQQQSRAVAAAASPASASSRSAQYARRGNTGGNVGVNVNGNVGGRGLSGSGASSAQQQQQRKTNAGRGSGGRSNHRGPGTTSYPGRGHQQWGLHPRGPGSPGGRGASLRPPAGGGRGLSYGRGASSPSSSPRFSSSTGGFPTPPSLSSPGSPTVPGDDRQRHQHQHQHHYRAAGGGGRGRYGRRGGEFRGQGNMHAGRGSAAAGSPRTNNGMRANGSGTSPPQGTAATWTRGTAAASSEFAPTLGGLLRHSSFPPPSDSATAAQTVIAAGARWLGIGAPSAGSESQSQRVSWGSEGNNQRSPALGPAPAASPVLGGSDGGSGGGGAGTPLSLSGLQAAPPLAPIGSNRHRRQRSDGSSSSSAVGGGPGPVGGPRRAPPGLSPSPFLSGGTGGRDPDIDNMDTFATASAVAAGVLDMGGDGGGGGGGGGGRNTTAVPPPPDQWGAALEAGGNAEDPRQERSFSVPSGYFGQNHASPRPAAAAAAGGSGSGACAPYGEQQDLANGGGSVFDRALEQGHYAHRQGGGACRAPAGTVGGSGGVGCDGARGSRLGLYMSSSAGNGGNGGGGGGGGGAQETLPEGVRQFETPRGDSLYFGGSASAGGAVNAGGPDVLGFKKDGDHKYSSGGSGKGAAR